VNMGEIRFDRIGGFTGGENCLLGPTVEGSKLFKGRGKFHSNDCYHIGPSTPVETRKALGKGDDPRKNDWVYMCSMKTITRVSVL